MQKNVQILGKQKINELFVYNRIEYFSYDDIDKTRTDKKLRWIEGNVKNISNVTWVKQLKQRQYYNPNKATYFYWDTVLEAACSVVYLIEPFDEKKWNKNYDCSWRRESSNAHYDCDSLN